MLGVFQHDKNGIPAMILPIMANGKAADYLRVYGDPLTFLEVVSTCCNMPVKIVWKNNVRST